MLLKVWKHKWGKWPGSYVKERWVNFQPTIPNLGGHQQLKAITVLKNCKVIGTKESTQATPAEASTSKVIDEGKVNTPPFPQRFV
jgi:hypothetical protein